MPLTNFGGKFLYFKKKSQILKMITDFMIGEIISSIKISIEVSKMV